MKSVKRILFSVFVLILGVSVGVLVWFFALSGADRLQAYSGFPEKPQGNYDGFYYENLSDDEKIAYELIMAEIEDFPKKIHIPALSEKELSNVFDALHYDNANFFFLGDNCIFESSSFGSNYFVPEYAMSRSKYVEKIEELEEIKDEIIEDCSAFTDDYDKELYVHDYIVDNCQYIDRVGGTYSSSYGCLVNGLASCEGYAKAMKYIFDEMGMENYIAFGTTETDDNRSDGHAWNIVKINSDFYHVDATWNDPVVSEVVNRYAYFNVNDDEISKTHDVDSRFLGICTATDENYYVRNSLVFSEYNSNTKNAITSEIVRQLRLENSTLSFKVTDPQALSDIMENLFDLNEIYDILFSAKSIANKRISQRDISYAIDDTHMIIIISDFTE